MHTTICERAARPQLIGNNFSLACSRRRLRLLARDAWCAPSSPPLDLSLLSKHIKLVVENTVSVQGQGANAKGVKETGYRILRVAKGFYCDLCTF
jgi:hypothetical protein